MIKLLDNVTTPANNEYLHNLLLDHPWYFLKNTAYSKIDKNRAYESTWQWMIYNEGNVNSHLMNLCENLLINGLHKIDYPLTKLIRIRAGFSTRTPYTITHDPHVDWETEHMTALYYVNDSDGDTIFYDRVRSQDEDLSYKILEKEQLNESQRITPKADRMVLFDGMNYHSSCTPTETDYRIILNFNFI